MSLHEYNREPKKDDFQEALANSAQNITNSINSDSAKIELKEEINDLKDVIMKRLPNENVILSVKCRKLEQKLVEFECSSII